ncbi:hypothetical protein C7M84_022194 [Penaeus vannamei]|uniref:Uncharacterized protein n=1 Tax=Penaeus vannamei TaxID=6689 RepID=A0A3R7PF25_PENVA|nr:hypothetical protein C7M84_022194 [Penaeus vannamei]
MLSPLSHIPLSLLFPSFSLSLLALPSSLSLLPPFLTLSPSRSFLSPFPSFLSLLYPFFLLLLLFSLLTSLFCSLSFSYSSFHFLSSQFPSLIPILPSIFRPLLPSFSCSSYYVTTSPLFFLFIFATSFPFFLIFSLLTQPFSLFFLFLLSSLSVLHVFSSPLSLSFSFSTITYSLLLPPHYHSLLFPFLFPSLPPLLLLCQGHAWRGDSSATEGVALHESGSVALLSRLSLPSFHSLSSSFLYLTSSSPLFPLPFSLPFPTFSPPSPHYHVFSSFSHPPTPFSSSSFLSFSTPISFSFLTSFLCPLSPCLIFFYFLSSFLHLNSFTDIFFSFLFLPLFLSITPFTLSPSSFSILLSLSYSFFSIPFPSSFSPTFCSSLIPFPHSSPCLLRSSFFPSLFPLSPFPPSHCYSLFIPSFLFHSFLPLSSSHSSLLPPYYDAHPPFHPPFRFHFHPHSHHPSTRRLTQASSSRRQTALHFAARTDTFLSSNSWRRTAATSTPETGVAAPRILFLVSLSLASLCSESFS